MDLLHKHRRLFPAKPQRDEGMTTGECWTQKMLSLSGAWLGLEELICYMLKENHSQCPRKVCRVTSEYPSSVQIHTFLEKTFAQAYQAHYIRHYAPGCLHLVFISSNIDKPLEVVEFESGCLSSLARQVWRASWWLATCRCGSFHRTRSTSTLCPWQECHPKCRQRDSSSSHSSDSSGRKVTFFLTLKSRAPLPKHWTTCVLTSSHSHGLHRAVTPKLRQATDTAGVPTSQHGVVQELGYEINESMKSPYFDDFLAILMGTMIIFMRILGILVADLVGDMAWQVASSNLSGTTLCKNRG